MLYTRTNNMPWAEFTETHGAITGEFESGEDDKLGCFKETRLLDPSSIVDCVLVPDPVATRNAELGELMREMPGGFRLTNYGSGFPPNEDEEVWVLETLASAGLHGGASPEEALRAAAWQWREDEQEVT